MEKQQYEVVIIGTAEGGRQSRYHGAPCSFCLFTDPELARIGLSETEAKASGTPYRLAKIPMAADLHVWSRRRVLLNKRVFIANPPAVLGTLPASPFSHRA